ncbi:hypothetical protein VKT23_003137 [Stygiomarasmius scandens]|uniref:Translin n=1 Tax=Marasmiellus scandens TaxID=2682957 RepID=A0ABR1K2N2_9AGAR
MSLLPTFQSFRDELDDHNDRREWLIKASRDVTNIAKKTIFLLHRVVLESENPFDDRSASIKASKQGREKLVQIQQIYASLSHELVGEKYWRYQRQVSPGLQEFIEALAFAHFLEFSTLISFQQVQDTLRDSNGNLYFPLTISDYLLGVSDLTGELMRHAISGFSKRGGRSNALAVCAFVRNCKADFERFTPHVRDLSKKQSVTAESLVKIEDAAYAAVVRSSEYDLTPDMLDDLVKSYLSNQNDERPGERWRDQDRDTDFFS